MVHPDSTKVPPGAATRFKTCYIQVYHSQLLRTPEVSLAITDVTTLFHLCYTTVQRWPCSNRACYNAVSLCASYMQSRLQCPTPTHYACRSCHVANRLHRGYLLFIPPILIYSRQHSTAVPPGPTDILASCPKRFHQFPVASQMSRHSTALRLRWGLLCSYIRRASDA